MALTAALMPSTGDPLLARYWCNNYLQTWAGETNELHVLINGNPEAADIYRSVGARVTVTELMGHGQALDQLIWNCDADAVVLFEDDAFVREKGAIASRLERILSGEDEIIACPRGGMSPELHIAANEKWGPDPVGPDTSSGYGLWPTFLFAKTSDLNSVSDPRWESMTWHAGQTIQGLIYLADHDVTTDTATTVAYQLHARHRITYDVNYKEMWQKVFPGSAPYFHAGGLSDNRPDMARADIGMESNEGKDWAHRFWWWRRIGHDYQEHYERAGLDPDYWTPIIKPWINWHE